MKRKLAVLAAGALAAGGLLAGTVPAQAAVIPPGPLFGATIDDISQISSVISSEAALPETPTTRVVFDTGEGASYYKSAVTQLGNAGGYTMGELLDSSEETRVTVSGFNTRVNNYLSSLTTLVSLWEVGNEVNGNWLGSYSTVEAKLAEAYNDVRGKGYQTAVTFYANEWTADNCGDGTSELTPEQFANQYMIPGGVTSPDYVFLSFYPDNCDISGNNGEPTTAQVVTEVQNLHAIFPGAKIGFGELGLPDPVTSTTLSHAQQVMSWGYALNPALPYYVGGYFWWYADEDCFTGSKTMLGSLQSAFSAEHAALG